MAQEVRYLLLHGAEGKGFKSLPDQISHTMPKTSYSYIL